MGTLDLSAVMDALAESMSSITGLKVYSWPNAAATPPSGIIMFPERIDFDATYQRGSDSAVFKVNLIAGSGIDKNARDRLSEYIGQAKDIKTAIESDPTLGGEVQVAKVTDCQIVTLQLVDGGSVMLAAQFSIQIFS